MDRGLQGVALVICSLVAASCGSQSPDGDRAAAPAPLPRQVVLGPQMTCVTGAVPACSGGPSFQLLSRVTLLSEARTVTFGIRHGCLTDRRGRVLCWGDARDGQMGGDPASESDRCQGRPCRLEPAPVEGAPVMRSIEAGWLHTCGLSKDGTVLCWGDDSLGQLGRSTPGPAIGPVEGLGADVQQVSAGGLHSCALRADGTVACWGDGSAGQLGQGAAEDASAPVAVQGLPSAATQIDAGGYHTCALLMDGGVACWGENRFGQLGDGTRTSRSSAVRVAGLAGPARKVDVGFSFSCALLESGAVQCWGSNELGELGRGFDAKPPAPETPAVPPATVEGLEARVVDLQIAGNHACAELEDGSILCWGANELGQLGDGTVTGRDVPVPWLAKVPAVPRPKLATLKPGPASIEGLDVSYHSGRVDWRTAVARGHHFGLTLATAGVDFLDPFFIAHWERMRQAGLHRGAYHFFVPDDDPEAQARVFLSHVLFEPGDLAPVVDVETPFKQSGARPPDDLADRLMAFVKIVEREVGTKPIIYTGPTFWNRQMDDRFGDYPLWIAEYGVEQPHLPIGWQRWHIWQWRGNADLPAVAPLVDLDRIHPEIDLQDLLIPAPAPRDGPDTAAGQAAPDGVPAPAVR